MKVFYIGSVIKGITWDIDYQKLDQTKLGIYSVLEVDESGNNPLTLDIARWWNRGKYYIQAGELYQTDGWVEPVDLPPIITPLP